MVRPTEILGKIHFRSTQSYHENNGRNCSDDFPNALVNNNPVSKKLSSRCILHCLIGSASPIKWQAITRTNDNHVAWQLYTSADHNEFIKNTLLKSVSEINI